MQSIELGHASKTISDMFTQQMNIGGTLNARSQRHALLCKPSTRSGPRLRSNLQRAHVICIVARQSSGFGPQRRPQQQWGHLPTVAKWMHGNMSLGFCIGVSGLGVGALSSGGGNGSNGPFGGGSWGSGGGGDGYYGSGGASASPNVLGELALGGDAADAMVEEVILLDVGGKAPCLSPCHAVGLWLRRPDLPGAGLLHACLTHAFGSHSLAAKRGMLLLPHLQA